MKRWTIQVVTNQVSINIVLLLGRVSAPWAAEFLVRAVPLLVSNQLTAVFSGVVAQVTAIVSLFGRRRSACFQHGMIRFLKVDTIRSLQNQLGLKKVANITLSDEVSSRPGSPVFSLTLFDF